MQRDAHERSGDLIAKGPPKQGAVFLPEVDVEHEARRRDLRELDGSVAGFDRPPSPQRRVVMALEQSYFGCRDVDDGLLKQLHDARGERILEGGQQQPLGVTDEQAVRRTADQSQPSQVQVRLGRDPEPHGEYGGLLGSRLAQVSNHLGGTFRQLNLDAGLGTDERDARVLRIRQQTPGRRSQAVEMDRQVGVCREVRRLARPERQAHGPQHVTVGWLDAHRAVVVLQVAPTPVRIQRPFLPGVTGRRRSRGIAAKGCES